MTRNVEASSGFAVSVRSPSPQDAEAIAELRGAVNSAEIGNPYTDAADVLTQLTDPGIDLERDWILVTTPDGELVGSGTVWVESPFLENYLDNYVHPDRNGLGLGTLLLDWAEGRAMEVVRLAPKGAAVVLRHGVWVGAEDGENLLRAAAIGWLGTSKIWRPRCRSLRRPRSGRTASGFDRWCQVWTSHWRTERASRGWESTGVTRHAISKPGITS